MDRMELSCKVCQHTWKGLIEPRRCPNPNCRSLRWKDGEDGRVAITLFAIRVGFEEGEKIRRAAKAAGYEKVHEWLRDLARAAIAPPPPPTPEVKTSRFYRDIDIDPRTGEPIYVTEKKALPEAEKASNINSGYWDAWMIKSKTLEGDAREESFNDALALRMLRGLELPQGWVRMKPQARMAWLRANDTLPAA